MREIQGEAKTIRQLLQGAKYAIDYYQREYKWQPKQVRDLLQDLSGKFLEDYEEGHERHEVASYGHYFLGSIIISRKNAQSFVIDGQQRLTTLSLLLIYLNNLQAEREEQVQVSELILSEKYGRKSFNLNVDERTPCMEALFNGESFDESEQPESVRNIVARYGDIEDGFPEELRDQALPYFIDWLAENVHLVEITAFSDEDAYTIFETMNDRGLSLSPTDMLKGYLLANITEPARKNSAANLWKKRLGALVERGRDEDADCLKSWLRSQYAKTIRERKKNAKPMDFDRIGSEFHRWVRDEKDELGLGSSAQFADFIEQNLDFYARWFTRIREASDELTSPLESVFYVAQNQFTLQYPVLLAPLVRSDSEQTILRKLAATAAFLDILLTRRIWNGRATSYSTMQYAMFLVMQKIRGKSIPELVDVLTKALEEEAVTFADNEWFSLHGMNGPQVHRILARITDFVETSSGMPSQYEGYCVRSGKHAFEVEHIWANNFEEHQEEFNHSRDFEEYRNCLGGLLVLPKKFNASYGALPYGKKVDHYNSQNLLARSLHPLCYERNPGFLRFVKESGLPFEPHADFKQADLDLRHDLYFKLADLIWSPDRLCKEAEL